MKADLISLQAVIVGAVILCAYFGLRWLAARRPRCRRIVKTAPIDAIADTPEVHGSAKP